ncbi:MAG TPA: beta-lactamase family protein [Candidatus Luteococcus avicola]|nr:beta-lactamase family protein [Candidatus Luteococcus avicola]
MSNIPEVVDPRSVGVSPDQLEVVDRLVEEQIASNAYQGIVVLVARHGKPCYFKAFGKADEHQAMKTDAIFRLASMSKVLTAVCVLQLWEQGRLSLSDPISTYLPEFANPQVAVCHPDGTYTLRPATREITAHDLLSMTAGMTNTWWADAYPLPAYHVVPYLYAKAGVRDDMNAPNMTLAENIARLATVPLIADPGTMFDYSNSSVDTLCRLVEVISGQDFDSYQREHILTPLSMDETWFFIPDHQRSRLAEVYWPGRDEPHTQNVPVGPVSLGPEGAHSPHHTYFSGAAGLHGTTADYFRFAQMLLNKGELDGTRILSRASVELMTSNQIGDLTNWQLTQNKWGYMLDIQEGVNAPVGSLHYLGGPGAYSWQGYFSTKFVNNPQRDTVILTMTTPAADGALPHNLRIIAAANAAVID